MPTREEMLAEVNRRRLIEEVKKKRESDDGMDPYYTKAYDALEGIKGSILEGVGKISTTIDRGLPWGAPLNAAIGAAQKGQPAGEAYANQYMRDNVAAPSDREIMAGFGVPDTEFNTPLIRNPFTLEKYKTSPAAIAGGVYGTIKDPTTYLGLGAAKGMKVATPLVESGAAKLGEAGAHFAEERAVKATTGESKKHLKKLAKVEGRSVADADRAVGELRKAGRTMLETDEAGAPVVGWFSSAEDIGRKAAAKRDYYGKDIGRIGATVEELTPNSIIGPKMAREIRLYAQSIPNVGEGALLRKQLAEEADNFEALGAQTFAQGQELKGQFPYKPVDPSPMYSRKDVNNKIHSIISGEMDQSANIGGPFSHLNAERTQVIPTEEQIKNLAGYGPSKEKYGLYKRVADAGAEQAVNTLNRRMVSPSSHAVAATTAITAAGGGLPAAGLKGAIAGFANQQLLKRGSAFAARAADSISKRIMASPKTYQKWLPRMQKAAVAGNAALVATHHQLMNADPEYRALMFAEEAPQQAP